MNSRELFDRATRVIPGGVNSPVRSFTGVGGTPVYIRRGKGSRVWTEDGIELVDFCGSWGPLILGHAHPEVVEAVRKAAERGLTFGANTAAEVDFAERLTSLVPCMEMARLVNSGTEAVMTAIRLARGATGRSGLIKFDGCYHGHADTVLVKAGSGLLTAGIASSAGVPDSVVRDVHLAPYNDLAAVEAIASSAGANIAAILVEPVAGNMGLVPPVPGFLEGLRRIASRIGAVLIFDEVITGFRLGPATYGHIRGVAPDLTTLGKIIGGGMPIGAVGGKAAILRELAPLGRVYQAGTLSGNPVAIAAGMATLDVLLRDNPYAALEQHTSRLAAGMAAAAATAGVSLRVNRLGSMFTPFFTGLESVGNLEHVRASDPAVYARLFHEMLRRGFYLPPSAYETAFVSTAHNGDDLDGFLSAFTAAMARIPAQISR